MSTKKTYKSGSDISINVLLPSKKNLHISFASQSNGSSYYITSDSQVQTAIERHRKFNKLFYLDSEVSSSEETKKQTPTSEPASEQQAEGTTGDGESQLIKITVSDLASAKDYLAETFGLVRSSMRAKATVVEKAAENGIEFVGL
ncbi:MAG: hypothetical protein SNI70_06215 [Rikenellaceae bacterium]